jgi:hypothetical protein
MHGTVEIVGPVVLVRALVQCGRVHAVTKVVSVDLHTSDRMQDIHHVFLTHHVRKMSIRMTMGSYDRFDLGRVN